MKLSLNTGFAQNVLKVRPGELRRTGWMFALLLTLVCGFITGRIIRDTLFLDVPNIKAKLPIMYVAVATCVAGVTLIATRLGEKLGRVNLMAALMAVMSASLLVVRPLIDAKIAWLPYVFYVWVDVFGSLMIVQFWTFANETFNAREAKRLFAVVGGGGVLANIVVGVTVGANAKALGLENLVFVFVAALVLSLVSLLMAKRAAASGETKKAPPLAAAAADKKAPILASRYLKLIALATLCTFLATTLGDYEFKLIISEAITDRNARAAYFGTFYGVTGALSAFVQFYLTSRILEKLGILPALLLLPLSLLAGAASVAAAPVLWAAGVLKGGENTLRYTINDATTQLLYLPIGREVRARAKAFIDGILKPLAIGLAGLALFFFSEYLTHRGVAALLIGLCVLWGACLVFLRNEYLKTLLLTLKQRRLDFEGMAYRSADEGTLKAFQQTLTQGSPEEMLTVLDLLGSAGAPPQRAEEMVLPLLAHPDDDVKIAALHFLGARGRPEVGAKLSRLFEYQHEPVRAAAVTAFCYLARDDAAMVLERFLEDESLLVQGATVAGLIKNGGLEGVLTAADQLKAMIESQNPPVRERAAWVLGEIGVGGFFRPLIGLLSDADPTVRASAIAAAAKLKSPKLIEPLLALLASERLAPPVIDALASYGEGIERHILAAFANPATPTAVRLHLCRVLQRVGAHDAVKMLTAEFELAGEYLQTQAMLAAVRICARVPEARPEPTVVSACIRREANSLCQTIVLARELMLSADLIDAELRARVADARQRLFAALSFVYPAHTLEVVQANLESDDTAVRANALEVLDNLLENEHKALVLPLLDEALLEGAMRDGVLFSVVHQTQAEWLRELLEDPEPWMVVSALHAIGTHGMHALSEPVTRCLKHPDPWVRETALWALRHSAPTDEIAQKVGRLIGDENERVRRYGEHVLAELPMISNVEKVLFLKKIDLFRRIRGDDLARIANIAEEISFDAGQQIFSEGELGDALYLVVAGKVKVHKGELQLAVLGERQCFGEISILDSEPRSASVTALEPLLALKIRRDDFSEIMAQKPEIAQGVIKVLCGRLRHANKR